MSPWLKAGAVSQVPTLRFSCGGTDGGMTLCTHTYKCLLQTFGYKNSWALLEIILILPFPMIRGKIRVHKPLFQVTSWPWGHSTDPLLSAVLGGFGRTGFMTLDISPLFHSPYLKELTCTMGQHFSSLQMGFVRNSFYKCQRSPRLPPSGLIVLRQAEVEKTQG